MLVEKLLLKSHLAIEAQSWNEAWGFLNQIDSAQIGSKETELLLYAATIKRHQGQIDNAKQIYYQLKDKLSTQDQNLADVIMGLAECEHLDNNMKQAGLLAQAARYIPHNDPVLQARLACSEAHIRSHINIQQSIELFQFLLHNFDKEENTLWANILFQYADTLLVAGDFQKALPSLLEAYKIAQISGATVTLADCMRRLPLLRALLNQKTYLLKNLGDLKQAKLLYELAGDRGSIYIHTEEGEVYRSLGRYREAIRAFDQGAWSAKSFGDKARQAHNLLGSFEVSRVMGITLKWKHLDEAQSIYTDLDHHWGIMHTMIARFMADPKGRKRLYQYIIDFAERSGYSNFAFEKEIMQTFLEMTSDQISQYPHVLNYP